MRTIVLASKSPRRRELLTQIGVPHQVLSVDVPEQKLDEELPLNYVRRLAKQKAEAGAAFEPSLPVLGADTIVVLGERVLEKPLNKDDFVAMMSLLSGNTHQVITAVALCMDGTTEVIHCLSEVTFAALSADEIDSYWATGEPADKAGGYGIQGLGATFVANLKGSYSNVVGLPLYETAQLLEQFKQPIWNKPPNE